MQPMQPQTLPSPAVPPTGIQGLMNKKFFGKKTTKPKAKVAKKTTPPPQKLGY